MRRQRPRIPRRAALALRPGAGISTRGMGLSVSGSLLAETRNTVYIGARGKVIKMPKDGHLFMLGGRYVLPGSALVGDPAGRLRSHGE